MNLLLALPFLAVALGFLPPIVLLYGGVVSAGFLWTNTLHAAALARYLGVEAGVPITGSIRRDLSVE